MKKIIFGFALILPLAQPVWAQLSSATGDDIGLNQLRAANPGLTEGVGIQAQIVEAFNPGGSDRYVPNRNNAQLTNNAINAVGTSAVPTPSDIYSGHATGSALHFFGSSGVARDVGRLAVGGLAVDAYAATGQNTPNGNTPAVNWIDNFVINRDASGTARDPNLAGFDRTTLSSHSYVFPANADNNSALPALLERFDHIINETDTTAVVGTTNGGSLPPGWSPSYNAITVGISNGTHGAGLTTLHGAGRVAIDVVAPEPNSSSSTPVVAGAVAILQDAALLPGASTATDAARSEVIRATILAGATKDSGDINGVWTRTVTQPLDAVFGAGEVNVLNSFNIQAAGEFNGGSSANPISISGFDGWDYEEELAVGDDLFYEFTVDAGQELTDFSIALAWNLDVVDTSGSPNVFTPVQQLANLSLELFDASGTLIDASLSDLDNVEHIYIEDGLFEGTYQLRVSNENSNSFATDFGLAFRGTAVPEPNSMTLLLVAGGLMAMRRLRLQPKK